MTLNLSQIAPQVGAMAREASARHDVFARRRAAALSLMRAWDGRLDALRSLVQETEPWLVAEPLEPLLTARPAPRIPPDVTVVATDGSGIDLDRHGLAQCYLINVGAAVITYGANPDAALSSRAALYYRDDDLYLDDDGARVPVQGALADLKRTLAEQARLLEIVRELRPSPSSPASYPSPPGPWLTGPSAAADGPARLSLKGRGGEGYGDADALREGSPLPRQGEGLGVRAVGFPLVAVLDGTLLLWQLAGRAGEERFVAEAIAEYAAGLLEFRRLGVPVCSYVSRPNGRELTNLLRLAACPSGGDDVVPTRCANCVDGECARDFLEPLPDRALMDHLRHGERSGRFASRSPVLRYYGADCGIEFVYVNVGDEVARLEIPAWVGADPAMLDLVHAAVYDGCQRGWGYPPALAEAHEQAVIRGGERDAFLRLVMEALNESDQPAELSAKRLSKNRRAV